MLSSASGIGFRAAESARSGAHVDDLPESTSWRHPNADSFIRAVFWSAFCNSRKAQRLDKLQFAVVVNGFNLHGSLLYTTALPPRYRPGCQTQVHTPAAAAPCRCRPASGAHPPHESRDAPAPCRSGCRCPPAPVAANNNKTVGHIKYCKKNYMYKVCNFPFKKQPVNQIS